MTAKGDNVVPSLDYTDPANWPNYCSDNLRQLIVQNGPQQAISHDYKRRLANEYLALFDPIMNGHLCRVKNEETMVHYLEKDIQNELVQLLAVAIKQKRLADIKSAKYYSVILDCTPDVSHTEQVTMIVCFVNVIKPSDTEMSKPEVMIKEHFLGFVPLKDTIGTFMTETLLGQLEQMGLPIEDLHDHGYDNGSNMKSNIYDALIEIFDDTSLKNLSGNTSRIEAKALADAICKFKLKFKF
nr:uncharacterized protein LOC110086126 [Pogona vitticeps]